MTNTALDLRLTDEEIAKYVTEIIDGSGPLPSAKEMMRGIADAATAKAAYAIVEWLGEWGMHSFCGKHHFPPVEYANPKLFDILSTMGIKNPAGDGEFHEEAASIQKPQGE